MGFKKSLAIGNKGQQLVTQILEDNGFIVESSKGKVVEWDIKVTGPLIGPSNFLGEVKFDDYSAKSGNLAIEFFNSKACKPSGITATTAELWFHVCPPAEILVVRVDTLLNYCQNTKPFKTIIAGGDGNASLYLYRKDEIVKIFKTFGQESCIGVLNDLLLNPGPMLA